MTILVTPIKPFRAWQYRKDSTEPVPEWVRHILAPDESLRPSWEGWWIVEIGDYHPSARWYTPAEFAERFRVGGNVRILRDGQFIVLSNGCIWPTPMDGRESSLEWRLRYGTAEQLAHDRYCAASIVAAYRELIRLPAKQRKAVIHDLRKAERFRVEEGK
jgi:hypothetical protein